MDGCNGMGGTGGNFSANPLFCNSANGDYRLDATSPCAPGNSPPGCDLIGALSVGCGVTAVSSDQVAEVIGELTVIPNPFRGLARFEYRPGGAVGLLNIFDANGRLIQQLVRQDGHWEWTPGASVPAGVYFVKPAAVSMKEGVKFLYLR